MQHATIPCRSPVGLDPFEAIWRKHAGALAERARHLTGDRESADDLVQDAFERALRAGREGVPEHKLRSWLMVILYNLFIDRVRAAAVRPVDPLQENTIASGDPTPDGEPEQAWLQADPAAVWRSIAALPEKLRVTLELRIAGRSYDSIGESLGIRLTTVGTRLFRARKQLRRLVQLSGPAPITSAT